jgi:hypothetical protein
MASPAASAAPADEPKRAMRRESIDSSEAAAEEVANFQVVRTSSAAVERGTRLLRHKRNDYHMWADAHRLGTDALEPV